VLPGVIGTIQATESIKLLLGGGSTLVGRLMLYDAWNMRFRELKLRRDPECPVCGDHPTVRELIDYDQFCGIAPQAAAQATATSAGSDATVREFSTRLEVRPARLPARRPRAERVPDLPHSRLDADPARQVGAAGGDRRGGGRPRDPRPARRAIAAAGWRFLREHGIESRNVGRHHRVDRPDRSDAAEVLRRPPT
jgi:hypothetical protein